MSEEQTTEVENAVQEETQATEEVIPVAKHKEEIKKVLDDMHKFKSELTSIKEKSRLDEEKRLKETNDYKTLYDRVMAEKKQAEEDRDKVEQSLVKDKKYTALREAALKAGLRQEAVDDLNLLSFDDVEVQKTDNGLLQVRGTDRAVEMLRTLKPHWFGKSLNHVNSSTPNVSKAGVANEDELIKMSMEAQKSGDYTAYRQKLMEFKSKGV